MTADIRTKPQRIIAAFRKEWRGWWRIVWLGSLGSAAGVGLRLEPAEVAQRAGYFAIGAVIGTALVVAFTWRKS